MRVVDALRSRPDEIAVASLRFASDRFAAVATQLRRLELRIRVHDKATARTETASVREQFERGDFGIARDAAYITRAITGE